MHLRINRNIESGIYKWLLIAIVYSMLLFSYITSVLVFALFLIWLLFSKKSFEPSAPKTRFMILFASLYFVFIIGLFYTENFKASISTFEAKSGLLIFPLIFGTTTIFDRSLFEKITTQFLIATTIAGVADILYGAYNSFQTGSFEFLTGKNLLFLPGFRPFLMGLFCLTAIIIAFEKLRQSVQKKYLYIVIIILSITVFLLSIRMMIFCWLLIVLYYILRSAKTLQQKIAYTAVPFLIIFISAFTIPPVKKQWNEFFDRTSRSTITLDKDSSLGKEWGGKALRFAIWKCSIDIIKSNWLFGVGTGDVQESLQQAYENRKFYFASRYNRYNAHNEYIQITLATGITGLLVLLSCILFPLFYFRKKTGSNIYILFLSLFVLICISESILEANKGVIWYSFLNSLFAFGLLKN